MKWNASKDSYLFNCKSPFLSLSLLLLVPEHSVSFSVLISLSSFQVVVVDPVPALNPNISGWPAAYVSKSEQILNKQILLPTTTNIFRVDTNLLYKPIHPIHSLIHLFDSFIHLQNLRPLEPGDIWAVPRRTLDLQATWLELKPRLETLASSFTLDLIKGFKIPNWLESDWIELDRKKPI